MSGGGEGDESGEGGGGGEIGGDSDRKFILGI